MRKKKVSKGTKKKLVLLVPISIIALVYFLGSLFYYSYKIYSLKKEKKDLTNELYDLKEKEDDLKTDIEKLQNPDYLARYARENYHYSKDGELVIQRDKKQETTEETVKEEDYSEGIIVCIVLLLLVLIYILKHKPKQKKNKTKKK